MSHRLSIPAALLVVACGHGSKSLGSVENRADLCIDPAAPGGAAVELAQEEPSSDGDDVVAGALEPGWYVEATIDRRPAEVLAVITRDGCQDTGRCEATLVRVADDGGVQKITARAPLPAADPIEDISDAPFQVTLLAVVDNDGDGEPEIWVSYYLHQEVWDEALQTSFPTGRLHVVAFAPDDLAQRLYLGHDDRPLACDLTLASVDADCDGDRELVEKRECTPVKCSSVDEETELPVECRTPAVEHIIHERAADGTYALR